MGKKKNDWIKKFYKYLQDEKKLTLVMTESYLPQLSKDARKARYDALCNIESVFGLLALENNIDLRNIK